MEPLWLAIAFVFGYAARRLREAGVDTAVNLAVEAGAGFARHALEAAVVERGVSS